MKDCCSWPGEDPQMLAYHHKEWGKPCRDDRKLFEYVVLDTFQAGLSWSLILHKRDGFRKAFAGFDPKKIARFGARDAARLMKDAGIIRNRQKIVATIGNAKAYLAVRKEFGSFAKYVWGFVGGKTIVHRHRKTSDIGATSKEAEAMSKDMKKRGFKFVGPTICYAFMQGAGLVDDHLVHCFRRR